MATTEKGLHGLQTTTLKNLSKFFKMDGAWWSSFINNSRLLLNLHLSFFYVFLPSQSHTGQVSCIICEYPECVQNSSNYLDKLSNVVREISLWFYLIIIISGVIYSKPNFQPERQHVPTNPLTSAKKLVSCGCMFFLFVDHVVVCLLILWTVCFPNYRVCYKLGHRKMVPAQLLT